MGGYNSGRPRKHTAYLGQLLMLPMKDVKAFIGKTGGETTCTWPNGSQIGIEIQESTLRLSFAANNQPISQEVAIAHTPCHYGKGRPWFICQCGKRAGKLFLASSCRFVCRACTRLGYRTQALSPEDRGALTLNRLKAKLDPKGKYAFEDVPDKPSGMHAARYEQIAGQIWEAFDKRDAVLDRKLGKLLERLETQEKYIKGGKRKFWD